MRPGRRPVADFRLLVIRWGPLLSLILPDRYLTRFSPVFSAPYLNLGAAVMTGRKNPGQIICPGFRHFL